MLDERLGHRVPRGVAVEHEVVKSAGEPKWRVPRIGVDDRVDERLVRKRAPELLVQRRATDGRLDLVEEDLAAPAQLWSAAFARSAILPNAAGSLTARSASTLRSSSIPALLQP